MALRAPGALAAEPGDLRKSVVKAWLLLALLWSIKGFIVFEGVGCLEGSEALGL